MTQFIDGPVAGKSLSLRRSPLFLRVVINSRGAIDALDLLTDTPGRSETIHVYLRRGKPMRGFIDGKGISGPFTLASYALHERQPLDEQARDPEAWKAWATAEQARLRVS